MVDDWLQIGVPGPPGPPRSMVNQIFLVSADGKVNVRALSRHDIFQPTPSRPIFSILGPDESIVRLHVAPASSVLVPAKAGDIFCGASSKRYIDRVKHGYVVGFARNSHVEVLS